MDTNSLPLVAANNTTINTYGTCRRIVDVGLKRDYSWTFIGADVKQPILGADFFKAYALQFNGRFERSMFKRYENRFSYISWTIINKDFITQ